MFLSPHLTLSLAAHPAHELFTLQKISMAHIQRPARAWNEDLDVRPRNPREYRDFTVSDQGHVIAGDVHFNSVNPRGMLLVSELHRNVRRVLTPDL